MTDRRHHDHDDHDLREVFRAARRADEGAAPDFDSVRRAAPSVSTRWPGRGARLAFAGALATVTIAGAALWLGIEHPPEAIVEPVLVERQPVVEQPAIDEPDDGRRAEPLLDEPVPPATVATESPGTRVDRVAEGNAVPAESYVDPVRIAALSEPPPAPAASGPQRFSEEFVRDVPVPGRFYQNTLILAPGGKDADGDGDPNVHGARERDFKAVVGGVNSIEEMERITAGAGIKTDSSRGLSPPPAPVAKRTPQPARPALTERVSVQEVLGALASLGYVGESTPPAAESYAAIEESDFHTPADAPLSTFSIDVDTASYANVRRYLTQGRRPPADAVRIEELINYFDYAYPEPTGDAPFSTTVEIADCPWNPDHRLARIGLRGRRVDRGATRGSNLVFLVDVSGSMRSPDKLPLLKDALGLLADQLDGRDSVALVVYAGSTGLVLPPTTGSDTTSIREALARLEAGGSTNGGDGLKLAYRLAREHFIEGGVNRVILATDGDFNVGVTGPNELLDVVQADADRGVFLTVLGFGTGNLHDDRLEQLADRGNGSYAYIDTIDEARKVLVEEIGGTLVTIAKDVKIQVEFNPTRVAGYRLIGYENRALAARDFNDDTKDAGEIGAGHTVTALYEIVPAGRPVPGAPTVDPLRYDDDPSRGLRVDDPRGRELFHLKLRYKQPEGRTSRLIEVPVVDDGRTLAAASDDFRFAGGVALFGMLLRDSAYAGDATFDDVESLAADARGADRGGHRTAFLTLLDAARTTAP